MSECSPGLLCHGVCIPECQGTSLAGQTLFPVGDVAKESGPRDYQDAWCSYDADTNEAQEDV